jgi:hypothetical protein
MMAELRHRRYGVDVFEPEDDENEGGSGRRIGEAEKHYGREGKAISNFASTLPPPQSDLTQQALKDPLYSDNYFSRRRQLEFPVGDGMPVVKC